MLTTPTSPVARIARRSIVGTRRWALTALACGVLALAGAAHAAGSPALNQLNTWLGQHHNHQALKKATAWLNLNDRALKQKHLTRYQLQCVRARALLRLSDFSQARDSYLAAARVAPTIPDARQSRAMADLIDHSTGGFYMHRIHQGERLIVKRIGIVPKASRRQAMQALARQEWKTLHPRIIRALGATSLNPTLGILPALRVAVDVQSAADSRSDGSAAAKSDQAPALAAVDSVSTHLATRITAGLTALEATVNNIQRQANGKVHNGRQMMRRGVTPDQRDTLENIRDTCARVQRAIARFTRLFPDFPKDVATLKALTGRAQQVQASAARVH